MKTASPVQPRADQLSAKALIAGRAGSAVGGTASGWGCQRRSRLSVL